MKGLWLSFYLVPILVGYGFCNNRDIIEFIGTPPVLRFALQVAMATTYFHKAQTCVSFKNIFSYLGGPKELFGIRKK